MKYAIGDHVQCAWGSGTLKYDARIVRVDSKKTKAPYMVHYLGWNERWNEWVPERRLSGKGGAGLQQQGNKKIVPSPSKRPPAMRSEPGARSKSRSTTARTSSATSSLESMDMPAVPASPATSSTGTGHSRRRESPRKSDKSSPTVTGESRSSLHPPPVQKRSRQNSQHVKNTKEDMADSSEDTVFEERIASDSEMGLVAISHRRPPSLSKSIESTGKSRVKEQPMMGIQIEESIIDPSRKRRRSVRLTDAMESTSSLQDGEHADMAVNGRSLDRASPSGASGSHLRDHRRSLACASSDVDDSTTLEDGGPPELDQEVLPSELAAMQERREMQLRQQQMIIKTNCDDEQSASAIYALGDDLDPEFIELNELDEPQSHISAGAFHAHRHVYRQPTYYKHGRVRVTVPNTAIAGRDHMLTGRHLALGKNDKSTMPTGWDSIGEEETEERYLATRHPPNPVTYSHAQPATTYSAVNGITATGTVPSIVSQSRVVVKLKRPGGVSGVAGIEEPIVRTNSRIARLRAVMRPENEEYYHLHVGGRGRFGVIGAGPPPLLPPPDRPEDFTYLPPQIVSDHCYGKTPPHIAQQGQYGANANACGGYASAGAQARIRQTTVTYAVQPSSTLVYHRAAQRDNPTGRDQRELLGRVVVANDPASSGDLRLGEDEEGDAFLDEDDASTRLYDQLSDADVHALAHYVDDDAGDEHTPGVQVVQYCVDDDGVGDDGVVVDVDETTDDASIHRVSASCSNTCAPDTRRLPVHGDDHRHHLTATTSSLMSVSGGATSTLMHVGKMPANILDDDMDEQEQHTATGINR